ncbi:nuclear transport factor 2 family protein (plasmid) [Streptomyces sp. BI20]|uniref:nuclear transport factor 2 family protein n=1 Tax=Streptomyces sp. BI20 TaxID=3403460 RepID=UPI003C74F9EA
MNGRDTGAAAVRLVDEVFRCYLAGDRAAAEPLYAEDFTFTSPQDDAIDRAAFFDRCFPTATRVAWQRMLQIVPAGPEGGGELVLVRYEYELRTGVRHRNTEAILVRDGRIARTEVYFGGHV